MVRLPAFVLIKVNDGYRICKRSFHIRRVTSDLRALTTRKTLQAMAMTHASEFAQGPGFGAAQGEPGSNLRNRAGMTETAGMLVPTPSKLVAPA